MPNAMLQRYDFLVIIMQDVFEILNYLQNNPKFLIVAKWQSGKVAKWQIKSATFVEDCGRGERLISFFSEYDWAVAHATGCSQCSQGCCDDARQHLQNGLPSFLLHSILKVNG